MCCWMGSNFHDWIDYNGVAFSIELLEWGRTFPKCRGTQRQFSENICSEDDLRSRIFGTFIVKFLARLSLLGFSNI